MNYLKALRRLCRIIFARLDRLPDQVHPAEATTRFILARDQFNRTKNIVNVAAFLPPKDRRLSIYRTPCCGEEKIWWLGDWYVARKRADRRAVLARADLQALEFARQRLEIRPDRNPHPRHANVTGWPEDKPALKMKAVDHANRARLLLKPEASAWS